MIGMRIAIPHWQGRVSPVFDESRQLLLVDILNNGEIRYAEKRLCNRDPLLRAKDVANSGTEVLICGAVSLTLEMALISENINVIPCTCGPVKNVIKAFIDDKLSDPLFLMPGCCRKRRSPGNNSRRNLR
jgi:predicted Fe-Mo cluster-binding NifX family protein